MSGEDFFVELRRLRVDVGPTRPMRVQCHPKQLVDGPSMWALHEGDPYVRFALFDVNAKPRARPVVEVDAETDPRVAEIQPGQVVEVAGTVGVGHAVVLAVDGRQ